MKYTWNSGGTTCSDWDDDDEVWEAVDFIFEFDTDTDELVYYEDGGDIEYRMKKYKAEALARFLFSLPF